MQWWCSAGSTAWSWTWQPFLGVWVLLGAFVAAYVRMRRRLGPLAEPDVWPSRTVRFALGIACLWLALDWPVGPLGANYLASVHMGQFLLVGLVAPLLILLGMPVAAFDRLRPETAPYRWVEHITHPLAAFFIFNGVITITHWPSVVDTMMVSQLGSFALDMAWLVAGLIFWWPLVAPVPHRSRFHPLGQLAYLGFNIVIIRPPMLILFYSEFPAYSTYELAPPLLPGASPVDDQQLAAGIMKVGSAWLFAAAMFVVFMRWFRAHQREVAGATV